MGKLYGWSGLDLRFRLEKYGASFSLVDEKNYEESVKDFKANLSNEYFQRTNIPVKFKEINDVYGRCFYLYSDEYASIEQKFQGP